MNILGVKQKCYIMTKSVLTCNPLNRLKDFASATASCDRFQSCYSKIFFLDFQVRRGERKSSDKGACGPVSMSCVMCIRS